MNPQQRHYAGFWRRLLAVVLDSVLVLTLTAPLLYIIYGHDYFFWLFSQIDLLNVYGLWEIMLTRVLPVIALLFYWRVYGATPGKLLLHCRIVNANTFTPPGATQSIIRFLCYFVSALPMYLGFFWIGWDKRKQGFHDKMARTLVLYAPDDYAAQSLQQLMDEAA